jgi:hypothetical protein
MKKSILIVLFLLLAVNCYGEDEEYHKRMDRIAKVRNEEIARAHELRKLELETYILAQKLELQRDNIYVNNDSNQYNSNRNDNDTNVEVNTKNRRNKK